MKRIISAALLCSLPLCYAQAQDDIQLRIKESRQVVNTFMRQLKSELQKAMKSGGPVNAIGVCNRIAPAIAKAESEKHGWKVARTSLKYRNPANKPDAWETRVLKQFEARKAKGESVKTMEYSEIIKQNGKRVFRYMKAIPTGKVCLKCHGENISPQVKAKLDALYPGDKARGFKLGDIRGAFTITQPM